MADDIFSKYPNLKYIPKDTQIPFNQVVLSKGQKELNEEAKRVTGQIDESVQRLRDNFIDVDYMIDEALPNSAAYVMKPVFRVVEPIFNVLSAGLYGVAGGVRETIDILAEKGIIKDEERKGMLAAFLVPTPANLRKVARGLNEKTADLTLSQKMVLAKELLERSSQQAALNVIDPFMKGDQGGQRMTFSEIFRDYGVKEGIRVSDIPMFSWMYSDTGTAKYYNELKKDEDALVSKYEAIGFTGEELQQKVNENMLPLQSALRTMLKRLQLKRGGILDPTQRGTLAFIADLGADPTSYITFGAAGSAVKVVSKSGSALLTKTGMGRVANIMSDIADFDGRVLKLKASHIVDVDEIGQPLIAPMRIIDHGLGEAVDDTIGRLTRDELATLVAKIGDKDTVANILESYSDWDLKQLVKEKLFTDGLDITHNSNVAVSIMERVRNVADDLVLSEAKSNPKLIATWLNDPVTPVVNVGFLGVGEVPIVLPGKLFTIGRDLRYAVGNKLREAGVLARGSDKLFENAEKAFSIYKQVLEKGLTNVNEIDGLVGEAQKLFYQINKQLDVEVDAIQRAKKAGRITNEVATKQIERLSEIRNQTIVRSRVLQFAGKQLRDSKTWSEKLKVAARSFLNDGWKRTLDGMILPEQYAQAVKDMARLAGYSVEKAQRYADIVRIYQFLEVHGPVPWKTIITLEPEDAGNFNFFKGNANEFELDEQEFLRRIGTLRKRGDNIRGERWVVDEIEASMDTERFVEFAKQLMKSQKPVDDADFILALHTKFTSIDDFMEKDARELAEKFAGRDVSLNKLDALFSKDYHHLLQFDDMDRYLEWSEALRKIGALPERGDVKWRKVYDPEAKSASEAKSIDDVLYYDRSIDEVEMGVFKSIEDSRHMAKQISESLRPTIIRVANKWGHKFNRFLHESVMASNIRFASIANAFRGRFTKLHSSDPLFRRMFDTVATRMSHQQVALFDEVKTVFSKVDSKTGKRVEINFGVDSEGLRNRELFWTMLHNAGRVDQRQLDAYWQSLVNAGVDPDIVRTAEWTYAKQVEAVGYQLEDLNLPVHYVNWKGDTVGDATELLRATGRNEIYAAAYASTRGPGAVVGISYNVSDKELTEYISIIRNYSSDDMIEKIDKFVVRGSDNRLVVLDWEVKQHLENMSKELRNKGVKIKDLTYLNNSNPGGVTYTWLRDQTVRIEWERFKRLLKDRMDYGDGGLSPRDLDTLMHSKVSADVEERIALDLGMMMSQKDPYGQLINPKELINGDSIRNYLKVAESQMEREEVIRQLILRFSNNKDALQKVLVEGAIYDALPDLRDINRASYFADPLVDVKLADGRTISLPRSMQKDLDNLPLPFREDKEWIGFWKVVDNFTQVFKTLHTVVDPAFIFRNAYSNVMFHFLGHGVNFANNWPVAYRILFTKLDPTEKIKLGMGEYTLDQVRTAALRYGIIKESAEKAGARTNETLTFVDSVLFLEKRTATRRLAGKAGTIVRNIVDVIPGPLPAQLPKALRTPGRAVSGRHLSGVFENHERLAFFLNELRRGSSFEEAAANVNRFLVDYDNLGTTEHFIKRVGVPFFTWFRNMLPVLMVEAVKKPGRMTFFNKMFPMVQEDEQKHLATFRRSDGTMIKVSDNGVTIEALGGIETPLAALRLAEPIAQAFIDGDSAKVGAAQFLGPGMKMLVKMFDDEMGPELLATKEGADALVGFLDSAKALPKDGPNRDRALREWGITGVTDSSGNRKYILSRNIFVTTFKAFFLSRVANNWDKYFREASKDPLTHIAVINAILHIPTASNLTGTREIKFQKQIQDDIFPETLQALYEVKLKLLELENDKNVSKTITIPIPMNKKDQQ